MCGHCAASSQQVGKEFTKEIMSYEENYSKKAKQIKKVLEVEELFVYYHDMVLITDRINNALSPPEEKNNL